MKLINLVVISGCSGVGKTTAAHALEDLGYYVVDNLPTELLDNLLVVTENKKDKIALVIDVRNTEFLKKFPEKWLSINKQKYEKKIIYLEASEQKLIDRYQETKRKHPLDNNIGIKKALSYEREILEPIYNLAQNNIITDKYTSHELRKLIKNIILNNNEQKLNINLISFGYKYGIPEELDLCFDVRFIKNPYYELGLRQFTGLNRKVHDYVLSSPNTKEFLNRLISLIEFLYPLYKEEGKANLTIALGCTGGKHRSIVLTEELNRRLINKFDNLMVDHRDIGRQG